MKFLLLLILPIQAFGMCSLAEYQTGRCMTKPCLGMIEQEIGSSKSAVTCSKIYYIKKNLFSTEWKFDHYSIVEITYFKHGRDVSVGTKEIKIMEIDR